MVVGTYDTDQGRVFNETAAGAVDYASPATIKFYNSHTVLPGRAFLLFPGQEIFFDEFTTLRVEGTLFTRYGTGSAPVLIAGIPAEQGFSFQVASGGALHFQAGPTIVTQPVTVEAGGYVSASQGAEVAFGPDAYLSLSGGTMSAVGATFTADDPVQGWQGLRFFGSTGACAGTKPYSALTDVTVEYVNGNSLYVYDAAVGLDRATLVDPVGPSTRGIYASGCGSVDALNETTLDGFSLEGALAYGAARIIVEEGSVENNGGAGVKAQNGATAFVAFSDFSGNARGFEASGSGSGLYARHNTLPTGQNNHIERSSDVTLAAIAKGYVEAGLGATSNSRYNNLDNTIGDDAVVDLKSHMVAEYNWWGTGCGPSTVTVGTLATFDGSPWLTGPPPAGSTSIPCGSGSRTAGDAKGDIPASPARAGENALRSAREALEAGTLRQAALYLRQAALQADAGEEGAGVRSGAFATLPALVDAALEHENPTAAAAALTAAEGFLAEHSGAGAAHRALALRAGGTVALMRGRPADALAAADALLSLNDAEHAAGAHALRVAALVALGRAEDALAAQAAAEAGVYEVDGELVAAAGMDLAYALAGTPNSPLARGKGTEQPRAQAGTTLEAAGSASRIGQDLPATLELGAPFPNPAAGALTLPVALPQDASVTVTVYDVLGRAVQSAPARLYVAGRHGVRLSVGALAPGAYVVRVAVVAEREVHHLTRRLTITR